LKTLAFLDFGITEGFIAELAQFASNRKNTTSATLHHVVIINSANGQVPGVTSVKRLMCQILERKKPPKDLL